MFSVREPSKNYFVISRHHFSSLAYIYMQKYFGPLPSFEYSIHIMYKPISCISLYHVYFMYIVHSDQKKCVKFVLNGSQHFMHENEYRQI